MTVGRRLAQARLAATSVVLAVTVTMAPPVLSSSWTAGAQRADESRPVLAADDVRARVSVIADSTLLALTASERAVLGEGYDLLFDAGNCRRLILPSCRGGGTVPVSVLPLMRSDLRGQLGEVLVVMAGYDDFTPLGPQIDEIVAEATAQQVARVVWLSYPEDASYVLPGGTISGAPVFRAHNEALRAATARHPSLRVADWAGHSRDHADWFASDGIHLTRAGARAVSEYINGFVDGLHPNRCVAEAATGSAAPSPGSGGSPAPTPAGGITPVAPARLVDTRESVAAVGSGRMIRADVSAVVPDLASAVVATVTAVDPCTIGWLTVFDCDAHPAASNVNYHPGRTTAGLVVAQLSVDREICVYSDGVSDVLVDVTGYIAQGSPAVHLIGPRRWVDTRSGTGVLPVAGRLGPGSSTTIALAGVGGVPAVAVGVVVNVTASEPSDDTFLSLTPGPCSGEPGTSSLNVIAGRPMAATSFVGLGTDGTVCVYAFRETDVILDVAAWIGPDVSGTGHLVRAVLPERLLDTRSDVAVGGGRIGVDSRELTVDGPGLFNITAADPEGVGWIQARPCGSTETTSIVNTVGNENIANVTMLAPGHSGRLCLGSEGRVHVIVDRLAELVDP